jgi:ABC-2 type transport system ATP-binding protein
MNEIPARLSSYGLSLAHGGRELVYTYDTKADRTEIAGLLDDLATAGIGFKDLQTTQTSLEDIFVGLVREDR